MNQSFDEFRKIQGESIPKRELPSPCEPHWVTTYLPETAKDDEYLTEGTNIVRGYEFNTRVEKTQSEESEGESTDSVIKNHDLEKILASYDNQGIQSTKFGKAVKIINEMLSWRLSDEEIIESTHEKYKDMEVRKKTGCRIWLSFTSSIACSGMRDIIRFLVEKKMVNHLSVSSDCVCVDIMRCLGKGVILTDDFKGNPNEYYKYGKYLRSKKVVNKFKKFLHDVLDEMLERQRKDGELWNPQKAIKLLGERIDNPTSIFYWAAKNNIISLCPGLSDGLFGEVLYEHSLRNPGLLIDVATGLLFQKPAKDYDNGRKMGAVLLGGGTSKHHTLTTMCMADGAYYCVYINTGVSFNCSDSGAPCSEAVTWGKINEKGNHVKISAEVSLVFPFLVARTFAKYYFENVHEK